MASFPKRILIAASIYPPDAGGPAVHAKAQFEGFPKLGVKTSLVALAHYRFMPWGIRHLFYFLRLISKVAFVDVVYAHDALGAGIPALLGARLFRKKFVVRIGGDIAWESAPEKNLSMKEWYSQGEHLKSRKFQFSRWLIKHADLILVTSPIMIELYTHYYAIEENKIKLLANPFPLVDKTLVSNTKQERIMIFASRLTEYKNISLVLKAMAKIVPTHPDFKFVIMGEGPEQKGLKTLANSLGISRKVIFSGVVPLSEVLRRTASCLFVIAPALTEFNPNYVLQGISLGKPFLISREHGLPFTVPEKCVFDPRSEDDLKDKILTFLDPHSYSLILKDLSSIDTRITWEENLKSTLTYMAALL